MKVDDLGRGVRCVCYLASIILVAAASGHGQNAAPNQSNARAAQAGAIPRIVAPIDETSRVTLRGNTHPLAKTQYDQGAVADSQPLHRMLLLLQRSAGQETALRALLDQQQSQSSPSYRQWLSPQQFGQQFGPADSDIQTVTGWLTLHGFQVARVSAGKTVIEFSGTAGQVRQAFQTEIHRYLVNGQSHFANSTDPSIPAALAPVVAGTVSLHNFPRKPQSHIVGAFRKDTTTGKVTPQAAGSLGRNSASSYFNFASNSCSATGNTCYALGPADWATIYNLPSTVGGAAPGTGQTIAIVGDSQICTANSLDFGTQFVGPNGNTVTCTSDDVATFRSQFGLPSNTQICPSGANGPVCVILDGPDPGFNGDETEGDLDTEWAGAVARNAAIDFVIAEDTETTFGTDLAAEYVVDNQLAPVLSESFGECESALGNTGNQFEEDLWEEAAAQGITAIVSSADSGSAACDNPDSEYTAQDGVSVNGIASTQFNVAAGGTDFDTSVANYPSQYWNLCSGSNCSGANNGTTLQSAKSYIPETSWNDSCAQNFTASLTDCNGISENSEYLNIVAGGGGQSNCVTNNGTVCTGGYSKPEWQGGTYVTGAPSTDNRRDIPDIAIFSADGLKSDSFYIICEADINPGGSACNLSAPYFDFVGVGGTSSAGPTFAGSMALVNQHVGGSQGNANYVLYQLANNQSAASCNSTSGPSAGCTFNDVTRGNNSVPCMGGTTNCSSSNSSSVGVLEESGAIAWNTLTGFDLATGLGSINVSNLVTNWATAVGHFISTSTTLNMCGPAACTVAGATSPISITHGQTVDLKIAVTPAPASSTTSAPENAALILTNSSCTPNTASANLFTSNDYSVANGNFFSLTGGAVTGSTKYLVGGSYYVKAHYTGDGMLAASDSNCISVDVAPENTTTTLTIPVINPNTFENTGAPTETVVSTGTTTNIEYGDALFLRADVKGASSGEGNASGTVTFTIDGAGTTVPLNTEGYAELQMGMNLTKFFTSSANAPLAQYSSASLAVGSHTITATYNGDGGKSYNASGASPALSFTVNTALSSACLLSQALPTLCPTTSSVTVPAGAASIGILVDTYNTSGANPSGGSFGTAPSGTVTFKVASIAPPAPVSAPRPNLWIVIVGFAAVLGLLSQLVAGAEPRRRLGTVVAAVLLVIIATAAIGCGSSKISTGSTSGGGSGGTGGTGGTGTTIGTASLVATTDADGYAAATATLNFTPSGSETITATYGGDTNYRSSTTTFNINVQ